MKRITEESQYRLLESNLVFDRKLNEIKAELTEKLNTCQNQLNQAKSELIASLSANQKALAEATKNLSSSIDSVKTSIPKELNCTSPFTYGNTLICPVGFKAVSCSCGMACGSYTVNTDKNSCFCHCGELTRAVCCKF